ncbi:hypothetical protein BH11GEM1_BH11GEM1_17720 [soil metagenome]
MLPANSHYAVDGATYLPLTLPVGIRKDGVDRGSKWARHPDGRCSVYALAPATPSVGFPEGNNVVMSGPIDRVTSSTDSSTPRARTLLDSEGSQWRVFEQAFADYDRRSGLSLIFASDAAVRRVRDYPANWFDLPDDELLTLSWRV